MVPCLATSCGKEHCMCDNSRNGCEHGEADCMRSGVKKTSTTCTLHQQSEHAVFCLK